MPSFTLPPNTRTVGSGNPPADMDAVVNIVGSALGIATDGTGTYTSGNPLIGPQPSGDTTGATDRAAVQAALNAAPAGSRVTMQPGQWYWNATVTVPAGVTLAMRDDYRVSGSKISLTSTFTGSSAVAFAAATPCGGVRGLVLDGSSLPAGTVDGIACIGACKQGSIIGVNVGHMTGHGINITASGGNPDGWYLHEISSHDNAGDGIHADYSVDMQIDIFHLDHNGGSGLSLGATNNCTISNGKCQQNTTYGYACTGGFVKSNSTFTACLSESNGQDGWNFNSSSGAFGSIQLLGCSTRDDGTSGTSGSGYSGFVFTNLTHADLLMVGCSNYITTSTNGPDYGLKLTGTGGNASIAACSLIGSVAAYNDGGSNTLVRWTNSTVGTGQSDATRTFFPVPAQPAGFTPADPTGTTSHTLVMMGLGSTCTYTPRGSGKVLVNVTGVYTDTVAETGQIAARFGTGTAPTNGTAVTGTRFGGASDPQIGPPAASRPDGFAFTGLITGLTPGTACWFDLAVDNGGSGTGTATVKNVSMTISEMP